MPSLIQHRAPFLSFFFMFGLIFCTGCWFEQEEPPQELLELSLFTGIPGVARLGEPYQDVTQNAHFPYTKIDLSEEPELSKLNFTEALNFKNIGTKVYFRRTGVALITAQAPFKGVIKNKKVQLFSFSLPPVSDWAEFLIRELGNPDSRASGGRFGSEGLFYAWGDINFNRTGANQLALYRDAEIAKYRLTSFGREVVLFPEKK